MLKIAKTRFFQWVRRPIEDLVGLFIGLHHEQLMTQAWADLMDVGFLALCHLSNFKLGQALEATGIN